MRRFAPPLITTGGVLALVFVAVAPARGQKPPKLSAEIGRALERDGVAAAQRRFAEIYPEHADEYEIDLEGFGMLAQQQMQSGDLEGMQAIMQMVSAMSQRIAESAMAGGMMMPPGAPSAAQRQAEAQRRADEEAAERADRPARGEAEAAARAALGEPRDDLDRFVGQYGDPAAQGSTPRNLFAIVRCDGYLVIGATFGDASNWHMRSVSDTEFETTDFSGRTLHFSIETGPDGRPRSMTHDLDFLDSPLSFIGPLPAGWSNECLPPPGG